MTGRDTQIRIGILKYVNEISKILIYVILFC